MQLIRHITIPTERLETALREGVLGEVFGDGFHLAALCSLDDDFPSKSVRLTLISIVTRSNSAEDLTDLEPV
jgi:hypothetical protein